MCKRRRETADKSQMSSPRRGETSKPRKFRKIAFRSKQVERKFVMGAPGKQLWDEKDQGEVSMLQLKMAADI